MLNLLDKVLEFQDLFFAAWAIKAVERFLDLLEEGDTTHPLFSISIALTISALLLKNSSNSST